MNFFTGCYVWQNKMLESTYIVDNHQDVGDSSNIDVCTINNGLDEAYFK